MFGRKEEVVEPVNIKEPLTKAAAKQSLTKKSAAETTAERIVKETKKIATTMKPTSNLQASVKQTVAKVSTAIKKVPGKALTVTKRRQWKIGVLLS